MSTSLPQGQLVDVESEGNLEPGQNVPLPPGEGMVLVCKF